MTLLFSINVISETKNQVKRHVINEYNNNDNND